MPHKTHEEVRGVHANPVLLSFLNDTIGRDVIVETRDGRKYEGIFAGCSPEFEMGLKMAHSLPATDVKKLLPHRGEIIEKLLFEPGDVMCMSVVMQEEKRIKGFATDQEYHSTRNGNIEDSQELSTEFEVWEADGEDDVELEGEKKPSKSAMRSNGGDGWSVDEMFNANNALGVKSTFEDNLSQYTTANVEEDREARLRAERIAQEIEMNPASRLRARLENDDEERDLNKETPEFQVHSHRRAQNNAGRNNYAGNARGGGNAGAGPNRNGPQVAANRRTEGAGAGGRAGRGGSGAFGSSGGGGTSSRSFTNSSLSHGGVKGNERGSSAYAAGVPTRYPPTDRPSAQAVHNEFGQWSEMRTGAAGAQKSGGVRQQAPAKVYESSHRGTQPHHSNAHSPLNRSGEDSRSANHSGSPHAPGNSPSGPSMSKNPPAAGSGGVSKGGQADRVKGLRDFHQNFNNAYQSTGSHASLDEPQGSGTTSAVTTTAAKPANAWNKGPPASIRLATATAQPSSVSSHQQGGNGAGKEPAMRSSMSSEQLQLRSPPKTDTPSASSQPSTPHLVQGPPLVSTDKSSGSTSTDTPTQRPTPSTVQAESGSAAVAGGSPSVTPLSPTLPPTQTPVTTPPTPHTATPSALSGAASSSSIAPIDPTPSATTVAPSDHTTTTTTSTCNSGKKFEFNPDAQPFTPRTATTHTPTPQSTPAPQPLLATHTAPVQLQGIALNNPQAIPLAQGMQPGSMMAHAAAPPQMFPYAASAGVYGTALPVYYSTTQPMMQAGAQLAQAVSVSCAASVAGGPLMAGTGGVNPGRGNGQMNSAQPGVTRRPQQQQQLVQGGGVYVPGQAMPYPQQMISAQYQVPFYTTAPYQQMSVASANMPPPSVPPPTSSVAVAGAPPFQVIQAQAPHQQAMYSRQIYQGGQPLNYMVATAGPRYAQPHQTIEYVGGGMQQCSQQPSSAGSSNGNSSNGHNSQPATPGPQPVASPAQQFPMFSTGQAGGSYVVYSAGGHQQMVQVPHPSAVPNQVSLSQAPIPMHHAQQQMSMEHYQGNGCDQQQMSYQQGQNVQTPNSMPPQYITSDQQQSFAQYAHSQQQTALFQQQQAAFVRQNSLNVLAGANPNPPQPYQTNPSALAQPIGGSS